MQTRPPFSAPGDRASGPLRASSVVWVFREFHALFVKLISLNFLALSCPFATFEPQVWR